MGKKGKPKISFIALEALSPSNVQPRTQFDEDKIQDLAKSIAVHGVLQPLIVRGGEDGVFEIIAGERRFRAARLCGLKRLPCIKMNLMDENALAIALVENVQREDLNPIEEAQAYLRLKETVELSQDEIAMRVGKDRATIANMMRLLRLPKTVQNMVVEQSISMGHARALLALDSEDMVLMIAKKIAREGLSVRKVESLVRSIKSGFKVDALKKLLSDTGKNPEPVQREIQQKLEYALGTRVELRREQKGYAVVIYYQSDEALNDLLDNLGVEI